MPKYLNYTGKIIESYRPDGLSRVAILESNEFYFYRLDPPSLDEHEKTQTENVLKTLAYNLTPKMIVEAETLKNYLENMGLNEIQIYDVMSKVQGYSWLDPLIKDNKLEDIHCFKPDVPLRVVHSDYGLLVTNIIPNRREVDAMVRLLAYRGGSSISLFKPIRDFSYFCLLKTGAALTCRSEVSEASNFTLCGSLQVQINNLAEKTRDLGFESRPGHNVRFLVWCMCLVCFLSWLVCFLVLFRSLLLLLFLRLVLLLRIGFCMPCLLLRRLRLRFQLF